MSNQKVETFKLLKSEQKTLAATPIDDINRKKNIEAGSISLSLKDNITILDEKWRNITFDLSYDKNFKQKIFDKSKEIRFYDHEFCISLTFGDYLYLLGKKLYARIGRKNEDGTIIFSSVKTFTLPNVSITNHSFGLSLIDIVKSKNQINYQNDIDRQKMLKSLLNKLKMIINTLGISDPMNLDEDGRLKEIEVNDDLNGVWLSFYLYGIKCLPCSKSREKDAKKLRKINDFSFLKCINNLGLDFGGTDLSEVGGLRLIDDYVQSSLMGVYTDNYYGTGCPSNDLLNSSSPDPDVLH